jgi:hypothetical protein
MLAVEALLQAHEHLQEHETRQSARYGDASPEIYAGGGDDANV